MKKRIFLALFALLSARAACAYDRSVLAEYNDLYKNGNYQAALDGYREMAAKEPDNPYAAYNAGNACFRLNKPGQAILFYSKAFRLAPRNPDIRNNLDFAMKRTGQSLVPEGMPKALHYLYYFLSDLELKAAAAILWWTVCLLLTVYALKTGLRGRLRGALTASGMLFAAALLWYIARSSSPFNNAAVITAEGSARLLSGPGETFKASATLPEARLVKVLDETDDNYYEVGVQREGIKGWVQKSAAEKI